MAKDDRSATQRLDEQYRQLAGVPERKDDSPTSDGDAPELAHFTEPEGGYGGKDGILNTGAINGDEARLTLEDEKRREEAEVTTEERARTQGSDPEPPQANPEVDVPGDTGKAKAKKAPAKKAAAKKSTSKKAASK